MHTCGNGGMLKPAGQGKQLRDVEEFCFKGGKGEEPWSWAAKEPI